MLCRPVLADLHINVGQPRPIVITPADPRHAGYRSMARQTDAFDAELLIRCADEGCIEIEVDALAMAISDIGAYLTGATHPLDRRAGQAQA